LGGIKHVECPYAAFVVGESALLLPFLFCSNADLYRDLTLRTFFVAGIGQNPLWVFNWSFQVGKWKGIVHQDCAKQEWPHSYHHWYV